MNLLFGRNKPGFDRVLLIVTLLLICLGVVIISSASIMESGMKFDDDMYQTKKHLFSIAMAVLPDLSVPRFPQESGQNAHFHLLSRFWYCWYLCFW